MAEYVNDGAPKYKMKGSPMQRNFGIKSSPMKIWPAIIKAVIGAAAGDAGKTKPEVFGGSKRIME
tara:strand:+ start:723 stop:917 length:195 start_codon:yes stop_codon:yes gene_type:complete